MGLQHQLQHATDVLVVIDDFHDHGFFAIHVQKYIGSDQGDLMSCHCRELDGSWHSRSHGVCVCFGRVMR
jgi:hypothetical protein